MNYIIKRFFIDETGNSSGVRNVTSAYLPQINPGVINQESHTDFYDTLIRFYIDPVLWGQPEIPLDPFFR